MCLISKVLERNVSKVAFKSLVDTGIDAIL